MLMLKKQQQQNSHANNGQHSRIARREKKGSPHTSLKQKSCVRCHIAAIDGYLYVLGPTEEALWATVVIPDTYPRNFDLPGELNLK